MGVLLFSHFPPEGSTLLDDADMQEILEEDDESESD